MRKHFLILAVVTLIYACEKKQAKTVVIGNQEWMPENLNVDKFRNGDIISEAKTDEEWIKGIEEKRPVWCYYEFNKVNESKHGKIYNKYAIEDSRGLAPTGFHIPTEADWQQLINSLGGNLIAGSKLKSYDSWKNCGVGNQNISRGNNESGFNAYGSGYLYTNLKIDIIGKTYGENVKFLERDSSCAFWVFKNDATQAYIDSIYAEGLKKEKDEVREVEKWNKETVDLGLNRGTRVVSPSVWPYDHYGIKINIPAYLLINDCNSGVTINSANKYYGFTIRCVKD